MAKNSDASQKTLEGRLEYAELNLGLSITVQKNDVVFGASPSPIHILFKEFGYWASEITVIYAELVQ